MVVELPALTCSFRLSSVAGDAAVDPWVLLALRAARSTPGGSPSGVPTYRRRAPPVAVRCRTAAFQSADCFGESPRGSAASYPPEGATSSHPADHCPTSSKGVRPYPDSVATRPTSQALRLSRYIASSNTAAPCSRFTWSSGRLPFNSD